MACTDVSSALRSFLEVQSSRAELYSKFQNGFKSFLQTKQEVQYKSLMAGLTTSFNECSKKVISLEATLKELGRPDLAAVLRQVQEAERDKLRLTLTLQALKQAAAFHTFSWQRQAQGQQSGDAGGGHDADDDEALRLLDPVYAAEARGAHGHGHGCHAHVHAHTHGHGPGGQGQLQRQDEAQECRSAADRAVPSPAGGLEGPDSGAGAAAEELGGAASRDGMERAGAGPEAEGASAGAAVGPEACQKAAGLPAGPSAAEVVAVRAEGSAPAGDVEAVAEAARGSSGEPQAGQAGQRSGHHVGGCGCSAAVAAAAAAAPEPTRREYEAAVKEAMQALDVCIRKINDALDDVRMELEE